jgi:hypothetical protein
VIKKISLAVTAVILAILVVAAFKSPEYAISRSIVINAPAEKIFPLMNNMKLADTWGPWTEIDPDSKMTYSGPESGVGAKTSWTGGKQLGTGSATIVESVPNQKVGVKLEYTQPMEMTQDSEYLLASSGAQTTVTWKVTGKNSFPSRIMCLFMNMDKMVGGMFEKGLGNLKNLTEKGSK